MLGVRPARPGRAPNVIRTALLATIAFVTITVVGLSNTPVTIAADGCPRPRLRAVIDPVRSAPLAPRIVLHAKDLVLPASGRFEWGDGRFGIASIGLQVIGDPEVIIEPTYGHGGTYHLVLSLTDACGNETQLPYTVHLPLVLPPSREIRCPDLVDDSRICVVPPDQPRIFAVPRGNGGRWEWTTDEPDRSTPTVAGDLPLEMARGETDLLQASRVMPGGWEVTPPLRVVALPRQLGAITGYIEPRQVVAGELVQLGFSAPAGTEGGVPVIMVDGEPVAAATEATVAFSDGIHEVAYGLSFDDGALVQRRIMVPVRVAATSPLLVTGVTALAVGGGLLFLLWRRRRRRDRTRVTDQ